MKYEAAHECYSEMYDLLSQKTRDEHSRLKWRIGVGSITVPNFGYRVVDVAEKGTLVGFLRNRFNDDEGFAFYEYQEPPKRKMRLNLLLRRQGNPPEWRIAMVDQDELIRAGDNRYWWFDQ